MSQDKPGKKAKPQQYLIKPYCIITWYHSEIIKDPNFIKILIIIIQFMMISPTIIQSSSNIMRLKYIINIITKTFSRIQGESYNLQSTLHSLQLASVEFEKMPYLLLKR